MHLINPSTPITMLCYGNVQYCIIKTIVSLSKGHFCQHGRHQKIGITNFGGILHHSARARKQKTLKILCFVICVEIHYKLIQTQLLI
jgi:hypothetical protein